MILTRICVGLALLAAIPAWCQVEDVPDADTPAETNMQVPPPVRAEAFNSGAGMERRSNYLSIGVGLSAGYVDNLYPGGATSAIGETIYSVTPDVSLDRTSGRQETTISYDSGYTFFQPSSQLNQTIQQAIVQYRFRFTPHATLVASDSLDKNSNLFSRFSPAGGGAVSGSLQGSPSNFIAPFADQLNNLANAEFSLQVSPASMLGGTGSSGTLHYLNSSQVPGLADASSRGASTFYNRRLSAQQYVGVNYQYLQTLSYLTGANIVTDTNTISGFYTFYMGKELSVSAEAGPEHYSAAQSGFPGSSGWTPSIVASLNWLGERSSLGVSASHEVLGGEGLPGVYRGTNLTGSARWVIDRAWTAGVGAVYSLFSNTPFNGLESEPGGHSVGGTATVEHRLTTVLALKFEYDHIHQSYGGIRALSGNPDSNNETLSLQWQVRRPLGR